MFKKLLLKPGQSVSQLSPNNMNKTTADKSLSAVGLSVNQAWCEGFASWLLVHVMKPWSDGQVSAGRAGSVDLTCSWHAPEGAKGTKGRAQCFGVPVKHDTTKTLVLRMTGDCDDMYSNFHFKQECLLYHIQIKSQLQAFSSCQLLKKYW